MSAAREQAKPSGKLGVVLVESPQLIRAGMSLLIDAQPDMHVLLEGGLPDEVIGGLGKLRQRHHVVAVVGLGLSGEHDSFWLIRSLRERMPTWPVIACGLNTTESDISRALLVGADGYINKECGPIEFVDTIRGAMVGELVLTGVPSGLLGKIADRLEEPPVETKLLTERELEVLTIATEGLTARQIGHRLGVRERTITTHLGHIYRKLGAGSRVAAIAAAAQSGLVSVGAIA